MSTIFANFVKLNTVTICSIAENLNRELSSFLLVRLTSILEVNDLYLLTDILGGGRGSVAVCVWSPKNILLIFMVAGSHCRGSSSTKFDIACEGNSSNAPFFDMFHGVMIINPFCQMQLTNIFNKTLHLGRAGPSSLKV